MNLRLVGVLSTLAVLGGCAPTNDDAMEASTASDAMELARAVDAGTVGLDPAALQLDLSGQVAGVGDCSWAWSVSGPPSGATYDAGLEATPCGGTVAGANGSVVYAVQDGVLTGNVSLASGVWSYDLAGSRTADTTITSTRRGSERTYTGELTLDSLVGTADGQSPGPFDAALTYTGWFGGDWTLGWSRDADGVVEGLLTGPRGSTCLLAGTADAITVDCSGA